MLRDMSGNFGRRFNETATHQLQFVKSLQNRREAGLVISQPRLVSDIGAPRRIFDFILLIAPS